MLVLGIETTCDETAAAIVKDGEEIISSIVASQELVHEKYGGVFPEVAARLHVESIVDVLKKAMTTPVDLIAVAHGPGLIGSILIGLSSAKALSIALNKPLIGINHVEAHLYAAMMNQPKIFPSIGVVVSGGHTLILKINAINQYEILGRTIDDAIGEAFDKVAIMLGLAYPGGPKLEKLAIEGDSFKYPFNSGKCNREFDFSFSGLKTNVLYTTKKVNIREEKAHIAASFQRIAFKDVIVKALKAALKFNAQAIYIGGGVSNSQTLKELFKKETPLPLFFPNSGLSLDNAAMIAGLAFTQYKGFSDDLSLSPILNF